MMSLAMHNLRKVYVGGIGKSMKSDMLGKFDEPVGVTSP